jgi:hypothetical protein
LSVEFSDEFGAGGVKDNLPLAQCPYPIVSCRSQITSLIGAVNVATCNVPRSVSLESDAKAILAFSFGGGIPR